MSGKRYMVVDTSVLMDSPNIWDHYPEDVVVVPLTVVVELANNKQREDDAGRNARISLLALESRPSNVIVEPNSIHSKKLESFGIDTRSGDWRIVSVAHRFKDEGIETVLLSKDPAQRIKAELVGIVAKDPSLDRVKNRDGWVFLNVSPGTESFLWGFSSDYIPFSSVGSSKDRKAFEKLPINSYVVATCGNSKHLLKREDGVLRKVSYNNSPAWGAKAKSDQQLFALDALLDERVALVAMEGSAGTGKTFLSIAAGLQKVFEEDRYSKLTILRPTLSVGGQDLGFLPGDLESKLGPWFETVIDTLVALSETGQSHSDCRALTDLWIRSDRLTLESIAFLRGRSLQSTFLIVDEVQNLETSTVKTIISRLGKSSKAVLIGDTSQIDNPWTSRGSNGLTAVTSAFEGRDLFSYVRLVKGERSALADLAAELL